MYTLYWLSTLMQEAGRLEEAFHFGERGLDLDPQQVGLLARMASIAHDRLDPVAALEFYERVAELAPDFPEIDARLADQLCLVGRVDEGIAAFERAIARAPEPAKIEQSRLFCLNFSNRVTPLALADAHRAWGAKYCRPSPRTGASFARKPADAPLHIAYVSADLRNHAVAHFLAPLLAHHDRAHFTVSVFDTSDAAEDTWTAAMRVHVDHWHKVAGLSDGALAEAIREAAVDVLFDLSGHTQGNRLLAFAERAAPVQVSWLGYLATTGVPAMDFRLTDAMMDPPGMTESLHTERLVRLPVQACFAPATDAPDVRPSPSQAGAPLTFGSVNQWVKVSESAKAALGPHPGRAPGSAALRHRPRRSKPEAAGLHQARIRTARRAGGAGFRVSFRLDGRLPRLPEPHRRGARPFSVRRGDDDDAVPVDGRPGGHFGGRHTHVAQLGRAAA